jgi:hypothetical protein
MTKNCTKIYFSKNLIFFFIKYWKLHIPRPPSYSEAFIPRKRTSSTSKHKISYLFFYSVGNFCPPGSGYGFRIRSQSGSGSKTLPFIEKYKRGNELCSYLWWSCILIISIFFYLLTACVVNKGTISKSFLPFLFRTTTPAYGVMGGGMN